MTKRSPFARRRHTPEFKVECVRVMRERLAGGLTLQRVSEELDIGPDLLRQWGKQVAGTLPGARPEEIFPGPGRGRGGAAALAAAGPPGPEPPEPPESPEAELRRLRRENERLRMEREFLKKAAAFFAKESR